MVMQSVVRGRSGLEEMAFDSLSSLTSFVTQSPAEPEHIFLEANHLISPSMGMATCHHIG